MSLFKSKPKLNREKKAIPLLSINESLETYKNIDAPRPEFGMDISNPTFEGSEFVILENNGRSGQGTPIRCDHFVLVLCLNGSALKHQNHHEFKINSKGAHLITPGEIHSFEDTSDDYRIYVVLFERSFLLTPKPNLENLLSRPSELPPMVQLSDAEFEIWKGTFNEMDLEQKQKLPYYKDVIRNHIANLLYRFRRIQGTTSFPGTLSRQEQIYEGFRGLIEKNFQQKKTVQQYADIMNLTSKHLSETVKKVSDHTALHFIQQRVIQEAQYLLVHSQLNVKEISYRLNFDTPSHFVRFFKQHMGTTPLSFRRSSAAV